MKKTILFLASVFLVAASVARAGNLPPMYGTDPAAGSGISNIVEDLSPQLGANLDGQTFTIVVEQIDLGTDGVRITNDSDGAITFLGLGAGADEDLTFNLDDTSNTIVMSSSTLAATLFVNFDNLTLDTGGVKFTSDGDGALTIAGIGDGFDEALTFNLDDVDDVIGVSSTALTIDYGTLDLKTSGTISGAMDVAAATSGEVTVTTAMLNTVRVASGAGDWTLPADSCDSATGNWLTVTANAAHVASIESADTGDNFYLTSGTAIGANEELDTGGSAWDSCTVLCVATDTWVVQGERGTCVDGGIKD